MVMGAFLVAAAGREGSDRRGLLGLAWGAPVLLHGLYNATILSAAPEPGGVGHAPWLAAVALLGLVGVGALALALRPTPLPQPESRNEAAPWIAFGGLYIIFGAFAAMQVEGTPGGAGGETHADPIAALAALTLPAILGSSMVRFGLDRLRAAPR